MAWKNETPQSVSISIEDARKILTALNTGEDKKYAVNLLKFLINTEIATKINDQDVNQDWKH